MLEAIALGRKFKRDSSRIRSSNTEVSLFVVRCNAEACPRFRQMWKRIGFFGVDSFARTTTKGMIHVGCRLRQSELDVFHWSCGKGWLSVKRGAFGEKGEGGPWKRRGNAVIAPHRHQRKAAAFRSLAAIPRPQTTSLPKRRSRLRLALGALYAIAAMGRRGLLTTLR